MSSSVSTLEYSVNGGEWATLGTRIVTFGGSNGDLRLRGKSYVGTSGSTISFDNATKVACSGDIRTLLDYENYKAITSSGDFAGLFQSCTQLTSAPNLPATELAEGCYYEMFRGCTSLTQAPELPATALAENCYESMFFRCTSLAQAPELPATNLAPTCYSNMFSGCSNLNYIKMMATDISASYCLYNWVNGVSSTGTFVKNSAATWDRTGTSGIPLDWTIQTASE